MVSRGFMLVIAVCVLLMRHAALSCLACAEAFSHLSFLISHLSVLSSQQVSPRSEIRSLNMSVYGYLLAYAYKRLVCKPLNRCFYAIPCQHIPAHEYACPCMHVVNLQFSWRFFRLFVCMSYVFLRTRSSTHTHTHTHRERDNTYSISFSAQQETRAPATQSDSMCPYVCIHLYNFIPAAKV
jgi:hypothetical protein